MSQLTLSKKEARRMQRAANANKQQEGFFERAKRQREERRHRAAARGWAGPGGGSAVGVEPSIEVLGTTVQVCGFWPFITGSNSPAVGVPLGIHLTRGFPICGDPIFYFLANLISNPSMFILGRPGLGKSSLTRRIEAMYEAWGVLPMVLGDLKPDHVDIVRAQNGQVIAVGPDRNAVNPLDRGPLYSMLDQLPEEAQREARADLRAFQLTTVRGLLQQAAGRMLNPVEDTLVAKALRILDESIPDRDPVMPDILELIESRHPELSKIVQDRGNEQVYIDRTQGLTDVLRKLGPEGPYGDLFSRATTVPIKLDRPVAFDLSSIEDGDLDLQAAIQQVCWAYGSSAVSAAKRLAAAQIMPERHYVLVMDEMWRMLRADPKLVHFIDGVTRLNRTMGVGQIMITHTMNDLKLPDAEQTQMAWGFVERAGMVMLGGLAEGEMGNLATVFSLSQAERNMITDWSSEVSINPETGQAAAPPGLGCFLMKIGKKPGIPLRVVMTKVEKQVNDTNRSWTGMAASLAEQRARASEAALRESLAEPGSEAA